MRFQLLLGAGLLTCFTLPAIAQKTFSDPAAYNNAIVMEQQAMLKKNLRYISKAAHSENERKIESRRLDAVKQTEVSLHKVQALPDSEGDTKLRDKAAEAFQQMLNVYSVDYRDIGQMAPGSTASIEAMEAYMKAQEAAEAKLDAAGDSLAAAQKAFAKRHGLKIVPSEDDRKMNEFIDAVMLVNTHQHRIVLAQFRVQKPVSQLIDALNAQDAAAFETARAALREQSAQSLKDLGTLAPYKGKDPRYRDAAKNLVRMYNAYCGVQFVQLRGLLEKKDRLSQAEATKFSGLVKGFNEQNQRLMEAYNKAATAFVDTNVPVFND
jgi:hypothetical protein